MKQKWTLKIEDFAKIEESEIEIAFFQCLQKLNLDENTGKGFQEL